MIRSFVFAQAILFIFQVNAYAQNPAFFSNYHILKVINSLPDDFLESSKERFERTSKNVNSSQSRNNRKTEVHFYELNGYFSEQVRFSGRVLIDDTVTRMLNNVADKLLVNAPRLRSSISIYTLRSTSMNAFATPDGMIFVNMGLIARLESEDELAFVLSHEIAHVFKQHSLRSYLSKYRLNVQPEDYRAGEKSWEVHSYSQFNEFEADSLGFDLFVKAGYDSVAALTSMDKLRYAEYPALNEKFDLSVWNRNRVYIPSIVKVSDFSQRVPDEGKSENSTHPATEERIELLSDFISGNRGKSVAKSEWFFRELALFECASLYNDELESFTAVYHCGAMLQRYPGNEYLETELSRALFGSLIGRYRYSDEKYMPGRGEAERIRQLFYTLSDEEIGSLVLKLVWDAHLNHPQNKDLLYYAFGIMRELNVKCSKVAADYNLDELQFKTAVESSDTISNLPFDLMAQNWVDKYVGATGDNIYGFALCDQAKDSMFQFLFAKAKAANFIGSKSVREVQDYLIGGAENDGIIALSPFSLYMNLSRKPEDAINFSRMTKIKLDISKSIQASARKLKVHVTLMNQALTKESDPASYNSLGIISDWLYNRVNMDSTVTVLPFPITRISELERATKSSMVVSSGYLQLQESKPFVGPNVLLGVVGGFMVPNLVWMTVKPNMYGIFFYQQFDIRSGEVSFEYVSKTNHQVYRSSIIGTHIYYCLKKGVK